MMTLHELLPLILGRLLDWLGLVGHRELDIVPREVNVILRLMQRFETAYGLITALTISLKDRSAFFES